MSKKARRGMHIRINWPILRLGVPEDFSNAESLTLHISRVNNNVKTFIPDTHMSITGNVVSFIVTSEMQKALTSVEYKATISYRKVSATSPTLWEPYVLDKPCFTLVDSSEDLGGTTDGMEVITIELEGEIGLPKEALPGASAYQIAVAHGFEGDEAEWLYSLKKPALDAADAADAATSELNTVMQILAQAESGRVQTEIGRSTAEQARTQAETARTEAESDRETAENARTEAEQSRETAETAREQAEQSRGTTFDQKIQESEQATAAANTAAGAQNTYNVTVAIPLAAGSYYTKTTARAAVPTVSRKLGLVITYATADKIWYSEKYIGTTVAGWAIEENWEYVPTAANMATKTDKTELEQLRSDIAYMYPSVTTSKRVLADAGTIKSRSTLNDLTNKFLDLLPNTKLLFCPHLAVKLRESGVYKYVTKLYDVGPAMLDGSQTTALNQPYLSGNIAPNEKYALKNPNGGATYMTHTPISFSATDKWSVSTVLKFDRSGNNLWYLSYNSGTQFLFGIDSNNVFKVFCNYVSSSGTKSALKLYNKNISVTITANGNGILNIFVNGTIFDTLSVTTQVSLNMFLGAGGFPNTFMGTIHYHCIRDIALSPTQVQDEYNYLRTLFPEIESVQIGTQTWATSNCEMTCTPQGNVIQEMQAATNVEKITSADEREFNIDTGWDKIGGWSISGGTANCNASSWSVLSKSYSANPFVSGKLYRISFTVISPISGSDLRVVLGNNSVANVETSVGEKITYLRFVGPDISVLQIGSVDFVGSIDNVSFQEVGWADSTNVYNNTYAKASGTSEQKEYAAVKAAAMWRNVNNDPILASVYGKKFNKYARKLLAMDIAYYNAANPTALWGWDIPTQAQLTTLASNGGNSLKVGGTNYWNTANGINSTGLTLLGGGYIDANGNYVGNKTHEGVWAKDVDIARVALDADNSFNEVAATTEGYSIRLIKV